MTLARALPLLALAAAAPAAFAQRNQLPQHQALLAVDDRSRIATVKTEELIGFALYTVAYGTLKLSAHLYPPGDDDELKVALDVRRDGAWAEIATAAVDPVGWTALFRVEGWDASRDWPYRVRHAGGSVFEGTVRRDPVDRSEIVAAVFTGNSPGPGGGKISKRDVVDAVAKVDPDVLLFTGDQVYNHTCHTEHWLHFGELFKDVLRDRPAVCIPDDHDVGQPNLWGQGGRKVDRDTKGGYTRPADYVRMVERQQTSHLPDPFDAMPIGQGIGVYYTSLKVGGVDFAIVEDRKFKSGCFGIVTKELGPRPDHVTNADYDPKAFDLPDKVLLGARQLRFLEAWGMDWGGVVMKCVMSQTVWSMASNYHSQGKRYYYADFDANGWPQAGRDRAVDALRRCAAFQVCGDQHLASIVQYGIDGFRDAGWAFCVPSIANLYPRWWAPKQEGRNREPGAQEHTGDYLDGFGNELTVYAHTNPRKTGREPAQLHDRMPGFGVVRFDKKARTIEMECWPRMVDPTDPAAAQYTGWPRTIHQFDNLGKHSLYLPEIIVQGMTDPLVQVLAADGSVVYTIRAAGTRFRGPVFAPGRYTVKVGDGARWRTIESVAAMPADADAKAIDVDLR